MVSEDRSLWLAWRREGIGASDVPGLLGLSPWASPWSIWLDKLGLLPEQEATTAMRLGLELEPIIGRWFAEETGLQLGGEQTQVTGRRLHHRATVDGFVFDGPGRLPADRLGVAEFKFSADGWEELPAHYRAQVLWQLHVAELPRAWVAALMVPFGRPRFSVIEVERDEEEIARMVAVVDEFWGRCVIGREAPPPDDHPATAEAIQAAWGSIPTSQDPPFADLSALAELIEEHAALGAEIKSCEKRRQILAGRLEAAIALSGPHVSEGFVGGRLALSWRSQERRSIDADAVRAEHGDAYDRTSTIRVLRHHKGKP